MNLVATDQEAFAYQIVEQHTTTIGPLQRTEWVVQASPAAADRFRMYRVKRTHGERAKDVIVLPPPLPSGFQLYEASDSGDYEDSFVAFYARLGYVVWGYSQRVQDLAPGSCESGAVDCSVMANWGLDQLLDDLGFVRAQACTNCKPAIGGVSLSAILAYGAVNRHPNSYSGVIGYDGGLWRNDPAARAYSQTFCDIMSGALAAGVVYDSSIQGFKWLAQLALTDPSFEPVFAGAVSTFAPSPVAFQPGYIVLAGDATGLTYSDLLYFARVAAYDFVDYSAIRTIRDVHCSLSGQDTTWTSNLASFHGNILVQASGRGFGQSNQDTTALATNAQKTTLNFASFGHVDAVYARFHRLVFELPILAWLAAQ